MPAIPDFSNFVCDTENFPTLFEVVPPVVGKEEKRYRRHCDYLDELFDRVPITALNLPEINDESSKSKKGKRRNQFQKRVSPRNYAQKLKSRYDTNFVINRVIVKDGYRKQEDWLTETYLQYGIRNIVLVGGESGKIDYPGPSVTEGNVMGKQYLNRGKRCYSPGKLANETDFSIGNICIPTRRRDDSDEPDRMLKKVRTGADFFTTQIAMEADSPLALLRDFATLLDRNSQPPPLILWSFTPVSEQKDIDFLRWLGVYIPDHVEKEILSGTNPAQKSIELALSIWEEICEQNERLPVTIPLGINVSVMGLRNFHNGITLAETLRSIKIPSF